MKFRSTPIDGAWLVELEPRVDQRGFFARAWCADEFAQQSLVTEIAQINMMFSPRSGTLRGIHYQTAPDLEAKTVRCVAGTVFDVVVDLRADSPTYRRWYGAELSAQNGLQMYVPPGCGHGFLTLTPDTTVMYLASTRFSPAAATGVRYDDPAFAIEWPAAIDVISDADRNWPLFDSRP